VAAAAASRRPKAKSPHRQGTASRTRKLVVIAFLDASALIDLVDLVTRQPVVAETVED
jgi:hypothetical protein